MRQTVINLELTSFCNRRCITCPQGNPDNRIAHRDMPAETHRLALKRVEEAADGGLFVREIINSGYGESFLYKNLDQAFARYGDFKRKFITKWNHCPAVSVVTNGSLITEAKLETVLPATDIIKFSFPTSHPRHYGRIMQRDEARGPKLLERAVEGLKICMEAFRDRRLKELRIHISPPCRQSFEDFDETMGFLIGLARRLKLADLRVVIFPSTSNRAGDVSENGFLNNFYRDHRRRYDGKNINGVRVVMLSELRVFYPGRFDVVRVLKDRFPCIWKGGSISVDSSGRYRFCINDSASSFVVGSLQGEGIVEIHDKLKTIAPSAGCARCNQNPVNMGDDPLQKLYSLASIVRMKFNKTRPRGAVNLPPPRSKKSPSR